jgi:hypothetical protein
MSDLMNAVHAVLVVALGLVLLMLKRAQDASNRKATNGASDVYKRIEDAERRIMDAIHQQREKS